MANSHVAKEAVTGSSLPTARSCAPRLRKAWPPRSAVSSGTVARRSPM